VVRSGPRLLVLLLACRVCAELALREAKPTGVEQQARASHTLQSARLRKAAFVRRSGRAAAAVHMLEGMVRCVTTPPFGFRRAVSLHTI